MSKGMKDPFEGLRRDREHAQEVDSAKATASLILGSPKTPAVTKRNISIKLMLAKPSGSRICVLSGSLACDAQLTEHEVIAMLFATEFAVNNNASEIIGTSLRMHVELGEEVKG